MSPTINIDKDRLTRSDPHELLKLAAVARRLPSWVQSIRAAQGGQFLSRIRGRGMEYDESRLYQPGDDIRFLDSRATARRGEAFTKIFREERERPVFICVDDRATMHFATRGRFKRVIASSAASIIAWKAYYQGERVGALVFNEETHSMLRFGRGRRVVMQLLKLLGTEARRQSVAADSLPDSLFSGIKLLRRALQPGTLLFLFSDFRGLDNRSISELVSLRGHCDIVLGNVFDSIEMQWPARAGIYPVANELESVRIRGSDATASARFDILVRNHEILMQSLARRLQAPVLSLQTDSDPASEIRRLFRY